MGDATHASSVVGVEIYGGMDQNVNKSRTRCGPDMMAIDGVHVLSMGEYVEKMAK